MGEFVGDCCKGDCEIELVGERLKFPSSRSLEVLPLRGSSCPTSAACDRR